MRWLKLHTEIVDDLKLSDLTGDEFRLWVFVLCLARENELDPGAITGGSKAIAWRTRHDLNFVDSTLAKFDAKRMVRVAEGRVSIVNFDKRQYENPSDKPGATRDRKRVSRAKSRASHDTETDTEVETDELSSSPAVNHPRVLKPPEVAVVPDLLFLEFWAAFPRRVGKLKACRLFAALHADEKPQAIQAAKNYAASVRGKEPEFVKLPATFLAARDQPWREWIAGSPDQKPQTANPARVQWTP